MIGVQAKNREEWAFVSIANIFNSCTTVAFYDTLGAQASQYIINQTELKTMFCSGEYVARYLKMKQQKEITADQIINIVTFEPLDQGEQQLAQQLGVRLFQLQDVIKAGQEAGSVSLVEPVPNTVHLFSYTSGTTGDPKGVMLTHSNLIATGTRSENRGINLDQRDTVISYLPYAHSFE